jgi:pimeloyl-ACP methyl ester carboxylesterase
MSTTTPSSTPTEVHNGRPALSHGMAEVEPGVRIHYVLAGDGPRTAVLLHGFPETWREWHGVIPVLAQAGFRVVTVDYRGAGDSSRPESGYDKRTMAQDVHTLLRDHLGIGEPVVMVGHDMGLMVAYAFASRYPDDVSHLVVMEAPVPGTAVFDRVRPRLWHFAFHGVRDVAESLVAGRERLYLQQFFSARYFDPSAVSATDFDAYVDAYAAPGGMRAGFETYRTFDQDAADTRAALEQQGKLKMPVLFAGGELGFSVPLGVEMMQEVAEDVTGLKVARAGHFIPEEQPEALAAAILELAAR